MFLLSTFSLFLYFLPCKSLNVFSLPLLHAHLVEEHTTGAVFIWKIHKCRFDFFWFMIKKISYSSKVLAFVFFWVLWFFPFQSMCPARVCFYFFSSSHYFAPPFTCPAWVFPSLLFPLPFHSHSHSVQPFPFSFSSDPFLSLLIFFLKREKVVTDTKKEEKYQKKKVVT